MCTVNENSKGVALLLACCSLTLRVERERVFVFFSALISGSFTSQASSVTNLQGHCLKSRSSAILLV